MRRYTELELKKALDTIEEGSTFSEVSRETGLNKSILARERRKRKNEKGHMNIARDRVRITEEIIDAYEKNV
ncbi:hypothetical protein [Clostridium tunisiense]|uniref:hypothetical protein n=1 Tax=Clostridium tunisiense TaxID=219748 RepID=UPI0002D7594B|nr:hypothetical protein [Clostridium tunisiense]